MIGDQDLLFVRFGFAMARVHHGGFAASLAQKLLTTRFILAVLHDIRALALRTLKD